MVSTEKAMAMETAKGRPSGTATITMETPIEKYLKRVYKVFEERRVSEVNII